MGKRNKAFYMGNGAKRQKTGNTLQAGMRGVLITFARGRDRNTKNEAYHILNQYTNISNSSDDDDDGDDIEASLKKQVEKMKEDRNAEQWRYVDSNITNTLFMSTRMAEINSLVTTILEDALVGKPVQCRDILRILPVEGSCHADLESIQSCVKSTVKKFCTTEKSEGPNFSYKLEVKVRSNSNAKLTRDKIISSVGSMMAEHHPECTVKLSDPDVHIILDILMKVCCVSVVNKYTAYKKYNLKELQLIHQQNVNDSHPNRSTANKKKDSSGQPREDETSAADNADDTPDEQTTSDGIPITGDSTDNQSVEEAINGKSAQDIKPADFSDETVTS